MDFHEVIELSSTEEEYSTQEPSPLTFLTQAKASPLTTQFIEYIDDLPEYPKTALCGYTYVVPSHGLSNTEVSALISDIQYNKRQASGLKRAVFSPFLQCRVKRWSWKCSGILRCEFLSQSLLSHHHIFVDEDFWKRFQDTRQNVEISETDTAKRNAYSYYRAKHRFFKNQKPCIEELPTCRPIFKRSTQPNLYGDHTPYVACIHETGGFLEKHWRTAIQGHTVLDFAFLEELFNNNIIPPTEDCNIFESLSSRRKYCEKQHPQGSGRLIHTTCNVGFSALIPENLNLYPYFIFTSHGIHKHPPPPPTKTPGRILQGIKQLVQQIRDPSMTTAQFLRNPQLEDFCRQYNVSTLTELHPSFCNKDKISLIIQKQRLLTNPNGQDVDGLIFLLNIDPFIRSYVQDRYHDADGTMIYCAYKEQLQLLARLESFEIDMSYKRLRSSNMNEVLFATLLKDQNKIITLLRVFTTFDTADGYYLLFKRAFSLLEKVTEKPILFHSIHNSGFHGVILDMDTKQYSGKNLIDYFSSTWQLLIKYLGLGRYLSEIDPQHRDYVWQLQHFVVFCRVHFQRTILKAIGTRNKDSSPESLYSQMLGLLDCNTEKEFDETIECFLKYEDDSVVNWANQKKSAVIKAGLIKACSGIPSVFYDQLRHHTNAVEQSHQKSYASGKYLTLVEAVKNSAKLDRSDIDQYNGYLDFNLHHSYRTSTVEANYVRRMSLNSKRRKRAYSALSSQNSDQSSSSNLQASTFRRSTTRSLSQTSSQADETRSTSSSRRGLRQTASTNLLNLEQRRQELEIQKLQTELDKQKAEIEKQREETREKALQNEERELDLLERRRRLQEFDLSSY